MSEHVEFTVRTVGHYPCEVSASKYGSDGSIQLSLVNLDNTGAPIIAELGDLYGTSALMTREEFEVMLTKFAAMIGKKLQDTP